MRNWRNIQEGDYVRWVEEVPLDEDGYPDMFKLDRMDTTMDCGWVSTMNFILDGKWHRIETVEDNSNVTLFFEGRGNAYAWKGFIDYMEVVNPKEILKDLMEWK